MRSEIQELINLIQKSLNLFSERKNLEDLKGRLEELEAISSSPDFWENSFWPKYGPPGGICVRK